MVSVTSHVTSSCPLLILNIALLTALQLQITYFLVYRYIVLSKYCSICQIMRFSSPRINCSWIWNLNPTARKMGNHASRQRKASNDIEYWQIN